MQNLFEGCTPQHICMVVKGQTRVILWCVLSAHTEAFCLYTRRRADPEHGGFPLAKPRHTHRETHITHTRNSNTNTNTNTTQHDTTRHTQCTQCAHITLTIHTPTTLTHPTHTDWACSCSGKSLGNVHVVPRAVNRWLIMVWSQGKTNQEVKLKIDAVARAHGGPCLSLKLVAHHLWCSSNRSTECTAGGILDPETLPCVVYP